MSVLLRRVTISTIAVAAILAIGPVTALGALSASVADLAFGQITYSHAQQVRSGTLTLTSTDTGLLGTNSGWNVTVLSSAFAYSGPNSGTPIPAANLAITTAQPPTRVSGQAISPVGGPRTTNATGALNVARKTIQADGPGGVLGPYYGIGTYSQAIDVSLVVPAQARAGTYTATLTVTISSGP
jgi:hypothetical protein